MYLSSESGTRLLWTLSQKNDPAWQHGLASFQSNQNHVIIFEGIVGSGFTGDIALDDLRITRDGTSCQTQPIEASPQVATVDLVKCSFDSNNFCNWINDTLDNNYVFNWSLNVKPAETDHRIKPKGALDTPGFLYVEDTFLPVNSKARIYSKPIAAPLPTGYCLSFYYHMFGGDIGSLTVYIINPLTRKEVTVFQKIGSQVDTWRQALVRINPTSVDYDFSLAFQAQVGYDYTGALAIDEIDMRFSCPVQSFCDFEVDTCNWMNDTSADFTWIRANNATSTYGTGPSTDHTTQSQLGYYMYRSCFAASIDLWSLKKFKNTIISKYNFS